MSAAAFSPSAPVHLLHEERHRSGIRNLVAFLADERVHPLREEGIIAATETPPASTSARRVHSLREERHHCRIFLEYRQASSTISWPHLRRVGADAPFFTYIREHVRAGMT